MSTGPLRFIAALVMLIVSIAAFFAFKPSDSQTRKPHVTHLLWVSGTPPNALIHYVTEEERASKEFGQPKGRKRSAWHTRRYSRYYLNSRSAATSEEVKCVPIADIDNASPGRGPRILGAIEDTLWLWNGRLEARHPTTLDVKLTHDTIRQQSGKLGEVLPDQQESYKVSASHQALIFKGVDTQFYQVDPTGMVSRLDDESLLSLSYNKSLEDGFSRVISQGIAAHHGSPESFLTTSFITSTNLWYALLSSDERARVGRWPSRGSNPSGEVARSLYKVSYILDDRKEIEIKPDEVAEVVPTRFIQAGFIIRGLQNVWDVPSPSSSLVLCKDALGKEQPWQVVRLARDAAVVWKQSTGLTDIDQIADGGSSIIFCGNTSVDAQSSYANDAIVWMDTANGAITRVSPAESVTTSTVVARK